MTHNAAELLDAMRDITLQVKMDVSGPLANAGAARFVRKPSADRWSAAECLEHLCRYGDHYLPVFRQALADSKLDPEPTFRNGMLGGAFVRTMKVGDDATPGRTMRSPKGWNPTGEGFRPDVLLAFLDQQEDFLKVIAAARSTDICRVKIPLSIAPWIKIRMGDMLAALVYHNQRHLAQAQRATKGQ